MDAFLTTALTRLDDWLVEVVSREERRSARLASPSVSGWAAVRALARPCFAELALDDESAAPMPALIPDGEHPLSHAARAFELEPALAETLLVLLAPHLEPRYRALYGVLQDDTQAPGATERLLLTVLGRTPSRRRAIYEALTQTGRLVGSGLVVPMPGSYGPLARPFDLATEVRAALLGLAAASGLPDDVRWLPGPVAEDTAPRDLASSPRCLVIVGPGDWRGVARQCLGGVSALIVGPACDDNERARALAIALWRSAALRAVVPVIDLTRLEPGADNVVAAEVFRHVDRYGGRAILRTRQELALPVPHEQAPASTFMERRQAWEAEATIRGIELPAAALDRLTANSRLGPDEIPQAFAAAGQEGEAALAAAAARLIHEPIRHGVSVPARRGLGDLVVRESTRRGLERLIYFAQNRDRVVESLALGTTLGQRRGPLVLFSGLSGTGKTLAAEAVAGALRRPLYVVDLSQLVSKYIGETEKHIDQVLSSAERAGVVLFFDEADAMFAARTEQVSNANDRFANLSVGFLLQRVERHDGLVILATNLRHAIDPAFMRRFQFRLEFPFPEVEERWQIWERLLPPQIPRASDLQLRDLAQRHRLSGGEIRNVAAKAVFLAQEEGVPLGKALLERAVALELFELGRLVRNDPRESAGSRHDTGVLLRRLTEQLEAVIDDRLRDRFAKEIHIVHGPPTREALSGRRPAVSVALFRIANPRTGNLRLGFVVSAWSHRTEEEHELLGAAHDVLCEASLRPIKGRKVTTRVQESYDFDVLQRFWSSHGQPVRASILLDAELT